MTVVSEEIKFDQILEELEILLDSDFLFLLNSVYAEINEEEKKYFTFKKISYSYAEYIIKRGVFSEVPFEYGDICTSPYPFGIVAKGSCEIQRKRSFGDKQYTLPDKILFPKDFIGLFENVDYLTGSSNTTPKWDITSGVITLNLINRKLGVGTCKTLQKRWNEEYSELAPFPNIDCDKVKTNDREFIKFVINQNVINVSDWDTEVIYFNPKILELVQKKCDNISLMKIKNYLLTKAWKSAAPIRSSGSNTFLDIKEKKIKREDIGHIDGAYFILEICYRAIKGFQPAFVPFSSELNDYDIAPCDKFQQITEFMTEAGKPYHLLIPKILSPGEIGYFLLSSLIPHSFRTGVCPEVQNGSNAYLHDIIDILKRLYKDTRDTDLKNKVESVLQNTSYYIPKKNRKDQNFFLQVSLTDKNLNYLASDLSLSKLFISENDYQCNFFETAIRIRRPDQV